VASPVTARLATVTPYPFPEARMTIEITPEFDRVMVYVSEQTNQRRPGVRLVCTCGWGIVAVHADQARPLAQIIAEATAHISDSHPGGPA